MAYEEKYKQPELPHSLRLEGREQLVLSGVTAVESFDESLVAAETTKGDLLIRGRGLHVDRLCLDTGELSLSGYVDGLEYREEQAPKTGGFFARLLR